MSKRLVWSVLSCVVLLLAASTAAAAGPRTITGSVTFESPWFWYVPDPQMLGWMQISAREVGLDGEATGWWRAQLYKEDWGGWRRLDGRVVRMAFGTYEGDPAVAVLVQITRAEGWGTAEDPYADPVDPAVGEYGWMWLHDGGPHGWLHGEEIGSQSNDHWTNAMCSDYPQCSEYDFKEYFPEEPDEFGFTDPGEWVVPVIGGNVTIHGE